MLQAQRCTVHEGVAQVLRDSVFIGAIQKSWGSARRAYTATTAIVQEMAICVAWIKGCARKAI